MPGIIRKQTEAEKDLTPIGPDGNSPGFISIAKEPHKEDGKEKFNRELIEQEKIATKKGLPFAAEPARIEFKEFFQKQVDTQIKKFGYIKEPIKPIKVEWEKYSDLNNFDLVEERERNDEGLSARYKMSVGLKTKVYKFKGFERYTYKVQEDSIKAIQRAKKTE